MILRFCPAFPRLRNVLAVVAAACGLLPSGAQSQCSGVSIQRVLLPNSAAGTTAPVDIRNAGDDRLFFVEQDGRILVYRNGALLSQPFLDIRQKVVCCGERGLLSLAFHPQYPIKPYFYIYYTNEDTNVAQFGDVIVSRYLVSPDPDVADASTEDVLIVVPRDPNTANHNGGQLQFGPDDGYLVHVAKTASRSRDEGR
jgi:glucose/arabinose dehydrogenase